MTKQLSKTSKRKPTKKPAAKSPFVKKPAVGVGKPSNSQISNVILRADIKWGSSDEGIDATDMPNELLDAKRAWAKNDPKAFALVAPFLRCAFVPSAISGNIAEILNIADDIWAVSITVYGVDFSVSNLPKIKASAYFAFNRSASSTKQGSTNGRGRMTCLTTELPLNGVLTELLRIS